MIAEGERESPFNDPSPSSLSSGSFNSPVIRDKEFNLNRPPPPVLKDSTSSEHEQKDHEKKEQGSPSKQKQLIGLGVHNDDEQEDNFNRLSSLPSDLSIPSILSQDVDLELNNSLHQKALHPNQFDDPINIETLEEHEFSHSKTSSALLGPRLSLFIEDENEEEQQNQEQQLSQLKSQLQPQYISVSNPFPTTYNNKITNRSISESAAPTQPLPSVPVEDDKQQNNNISEIQRKKSYRDQPIDYYHPIKSILPLLNVQTRELGPEERENFKHQQGDGKKDEGPSVGLVPVYKTPGQFPFSGSINSLPKARPSYDTMKSSNYDTADDMEPPSPIDVTKGYDSKTSSYSIPPVPPLPPDLEEDEKPYVNSMPPPKQKYIRPMPSTERLLQTRCDQRRDPSSHSLLQNPRTSSSTAHSQHQSMSTKYSQNFLTLPRPPSSKAIYRTDVIGKRSRRQSKYHSSYLGIPFGTGQPPSTVLEKFYREPETETIHDPSNMDLEANKDSQPINIFEKEEIDDYGRPVCSQLAARLLLGIFIIFPPLWFLMGAGYLDQSVGVIPKREKWIALSLGAAFFLIVIICIIIGAVVGT